MKVKTQDLMPPALDWAVAKAEGIDFAENGWNPVNVFLGARVAGHHRYSSAWVSGGPIIDRELHAFDHMQSKQGRGVTAIIKREDMRNGGWCHGYGPTPLIAAMRCYVAFKLGDEVEIPEELK